MNREPDQTQHNPRRNHYAEATGGNNPLRFFTELLLGNWPNFKASTSFPVVFIYTGPSAPLAPSTQAPASPPPPPSTEEGVPPAGRDGGRVPPGLRGATEATERQGP